MPLLSAERSPCLHCGTNKSCGRKLPTIEYTPQEIVENTLEMGHLDLAPENTWGEIPFTTLSTIFGVSAALGSRDAESKSDQTSAGSHSMDTPL